MNMYEIKIMRKQNCVTAITNGADPPLQKNPVLCLYLNLIFGKGARQQMHLLVTGAAGMVGRKLVGRRN